MFIYNGLVFQRLFPIWFGGFPESSTVTLENSCDLEDLCLLNPWHIITVSKQLKQSQKPADTYADVYLKHVGGIPIDPVIPNLRRCLPGCLQGMCSKKRLEEAANRLSLFLGVHINSKPSDHSWGSAQGLRTLDKVVRCIVWVVVVIFHDPLLLPSNFTKNCLPVWNFP